MDKLLFDTHTHLNVDAFADDAAAAITRAHEAGVGRFAVVGFDADTIKKSLENNSTDKMKAFLFGLIKGGDSYLTNRTVRVKL